MRIASALHLAARLRAVFNQVARQVDDVQSVLQVLQENFRVWAIGTVSVRYVKAIDDSRKLFLCLPILHV